MKCLAVQDRVDCLDTINFVVMYSYCTTVCTVCGLLEHSKKTHGLVSALVGTRRRRGRRRALHLLEFGGDRLGHVGLRQLLLVFARRVRAHHVGRVLGGRVLGHLPDAVVAHRPERHVHRPRLRHRCVARAALLLVRAERVET